MFSYRSILTLVIFIAIIFITIAILRSNYQCPKQKVVYRYLPRTFEQEQSEPVYVSDIFNTMFSQPSVWTTSINQLDADKTDSINKYFITQT